MIFKRVSYLIITIIIGFTLNAAAQCHVKVLKNGSVITAENPEHYIYNRTDSSYNGISIRTLYSKQSGVKKHELIILYTSSTTDTISQLKFNSLDGTDATMLLKLLGLKKNDNPKQHTKVYQVYLTSEQITYFTSHSLRSIEIPDGPGKSEPILKVAEPAFLSEQLVCLLK